MNKNKKILKSAELKKMRTSVRDLKERINRRVALKAPVRKEINWQRLQKMPKTERWAFAHKELTAIVGRETSLDIKKLIKIIKKLYKHFKSQPDSDFSTHQFITEQAAKLLSLTDVSLVRSLKKFCIKPDQVRSDMFDLIQEGHFYGRLKKGNYGNYLTDFFNPLAVKAMKRFKKFIGGPDEDIDEHAHDNFCSRYKNYLKKQDNEELGVAAHYLQDLTAPHHVSNLPSFLPEPDSCDTHVKFENWAKEYLQKHSDELGINMNNYIKFKSELACDPRKNPKQFIDKIHKSALAFIFDIHDEKNWPGLVSKAIPLAIFATAYIFEPLVQ